MAVSDDSTNSVKALKEQKGINNKSDTFHINSQLNGPK